MKNLFLLLIIFLAFNCGAFDFSKIEKKVNGKTDVVFSKLKDLILADGYILTEENPESGILTTNWKKLDKSENNIPDNTIEGMIGITVSKVEGDVKIVLEVRKRSSLNWINNKKEPQEYDEIGILNNDLLYIKWQKTLEHFKVD